ncbi:MAG: acetoin dehydrogenase dihydrolipoyllysine-residue acetyltransferase subunit [Gammaproteobacteria bacterium]|nr:acetoin dehydrogenase dihydrolipoyllysine-residue acetyltransferase subunit [Gammaproteobacteria bacterium]
MSGVTAITMPKWGLSMTEGKVVEWLVEEGRELKPGDPVVDIETEKIANTFEALEPGLLRRIVAMADDVLPIGALLGVMAAAAVPDAEVDAFVAEFLASYVPPAPAEGDTGPAYQWVETGSHRLRYSVLGESGPAVILIHGFGGDLNNWLFNQEPLAAKGQVYALDLPGHGQSAKQVVDPSVAGLGCAVLAFMDALGITKAHLAGHSLGGAIALSVAQQAPSRVSSLTLLAPAGLGEAINGSYLRGFIAAESRRDLKPLLQQLVANPALVNRQMTDDILKFKRLDGVPAALSAIADGFCQGDTQTSVLRAGLAQLSCPVQVIWGERDAIIPATQGAGLPANVQVEIVPGVGHLVHLEAASVVNARLAKALG